MSFFLKPKKGKRAGKNDEKNVNRKKKKSEDEEFYSGSENLSGDEVGSVASDDEEEETAQEKRLRLAKEYLAKLEAKEGSEELQKAVDRDAIAHRLQEDVLEHAGRLQRSIADSYKSPSPDSVRYFKGHKLTVTCVAITENSKYVFSGSKDGCIFKWDIKTGRKLGKVPGIRKGDDVFKVGHKGHILSIAITSDGKYLATGGESQEIYIWNPDTLEHIHTFKGHKKSVTGLAFRRGTHQLFSASSDRSVKIWNLDEMAYVETLFGHEDSVLAIDSMVKDRALTCGARDRSVRLWKVPEESQLVFKDERSSSIDCISMINEETFVSANDEGTLSLWSVRKKRPLTTVRKAHSAAGGDSKGIKECWVSSLAAVRNSDVVASGSCDSNIRVWKCEQGFKGLKPLFSIPVDGFVNSLSFSESGDILVAAIGQEHRLGRWWRNKTARNTVCVISLEKINGTT